MFSRTEQLRPFIKNPFRDDGESLSRFGFKPGEKISSLNNFAKQIESYSLHVIEDRPVSNIYSYFIDNDKIYIDNKKETTLFVDLQERGGLANFGTRSAINHALSHPGQIIFWYSPPGPVAFEMGTRYDKVKPYTDGQLYLLVGKNHHQVDAMAMSVAKENEKKILTAFLGKENMNYGGFDNEVAKIKYFLTNPLTTNWDIEGLLSYLESISYLDDFPVYKNVHGQVFNLSEVISDFKKGWSGEIEPKIVISNQTLLNILKTGGKAEDIYNMQLTNYFPIYAKDGKMSLGGSCGGIVVSQSDFAKLISLEVNPLSTNYRISIPTIQEIFDGKDNEGRYKDYNCPKCGTKITGEVKGSDPSTWTQTCSCGYTFICGVGFVGFSVN